MSDKKPFTTRRNLARSLVIRRIYEGRYTKITFITIVTTFRWSQVEISEGYGSEDFHLSTTVDAFDSYNPVMSSRYPRVPGGAPPAVLRATLLGLSPSSEFNIRVAAVSRYVHCC